MSKLAGPAGGQTVGIAGAAAAAVVGGGLYVAGVFTPEPDVPADPQPVAQVQPEEDTPVEAAEEQATEPAGPVETAEDTATAEETETETVTAPAPPKISTFRLDLDGQMLVAGTSHPGWEVSILIDDMVLSTVLPEGNGDFVQFLEVEASADPRVLTLAMHPPEGERVLSPDEIIIAPTPQVAEAATPEADEAPEAAVVATADASATEEDDAQAITGSDAPDTPDAVETAALDPGVTWPQDSEPSQADPDTPEVTADPRRCGRGRRL